MEGNVIRSGEKLEETYRDNATVDVEYKEGDFVDFTFSIKYSGCVDIHRHFIGESDDWDYLHICDLDEFIELLQELKKHKPSGVEW